jgi:DNA-binding response OmpR family regulator
VLAVTDVALVEDDPAIRSALARALTQRGHQVRTAATGLGALSQIVEHTPELVVLDLGLPDIDGLELLRMLRAVSTVPVIVATARDDEAEIVRTLDAGADDYLIKPYSADQLEARMRAVLRRSQPDPNQLEAITVGQLVLDPANRKVTLNDRPLELSRKEFELLWHLARQAGRIVSKRQLLADVWQQPYGGADKTVDVHLSWLRRKLGETASQPQYLRSVRGVGIMLVDPNQ